MRNEDEWTDREAVAVRIALGFEAWTLSDEDSISDVDEPLHNIKPIIFYAAERDRRVSRHVFKSANEPNPREIVRYRYNIRRSGSVPFLHAADWI